MEPLEIFEISQQGIYVFLKVAAPAMLVALSVGLVISLLQALTQIQEQTLTFVPKVFALMLCLILTMPFMSATLKSYTEAIQERIIGQPPS